MPQNISSWLSSCLVSFSVLLSLPALGQIVPDQTTPTDILGNCNVRCDITGGIRADSNLFHSFEQFNIRQGESVYFVSPDIANIFTRVTGSNGSEIFGKLGVTGNANLWLLNPQGIIFGEGSSLDVNGSFIATTADAIGFGDRGAFSATPNPSENLPLLTIQPSAFFSTQTRQNQPLEIRETTLRVEPQQSIVLIGVSGANQTQGIIVEQANLEVSKGNIHLGAITNDSEISITPNLTLELFPETVTSDITITNSGIDVSGFTGGNIDIKAANLELLNDSNISADAVTSTDFDLAAISPEDFVLGEIKIATESLVLEQSAIYSRTFNSNDGVNIDIKTNSLKIAGNGSNTFNQLIALTLDGEIFPGLTIPGLLTNSVGSATAGDIRIQSEQIELTEGALITSTAFQNGTGGNIEIQADELVDLDLGAIVSFSAMGSSADSGNLTLRTQDLALRNGSIISTATLGQGQGGDIDITAKSINLAAALIDALPTAIWTNSIFPGSGDAGNLTINTENLIVEGGAQVSSGSGLLTQQAFIPFGGAGGNIEINASESIIVRGDFGLEFIPSLIGSNTANSSPAGDIQIDTGTLTVSGNATISTASLGTGNSGDLTIRASESIEGIGINTEIFQAFILNASQLDFDSTISGGGFTTFTLDGRGGDLTLETPSLGISNGFVIGSGSFGEGDAGDVIIDAQQSVIVETSAIGTSALSSGNAGNIELDTQNLLVRNGGVISTSISSLGEAGELKINASESIELTNDPDFVFPFSGGITTGNFGGELVNAGTLSLKTRRLSVGGGANIDITNTNPFNRIPSIASSSLEPSTSQIEATESITIQGRSELFADSAISPDIETNIITSRISTFTRTDAPASNIKIITPTLNILERGEISVSSFSSGSAGNLEILADNVTLSGGQLNATTIFGQGGNISLEATDTLKLSEAASITTNAISEDVSGNGGRIMINAPFVITFPGTSISANSITGNGGTVDIEAQNIFAVNPQGQFSANSGIGQDGEVTLSTFSDDFFQDVTRLPEKPLSQDNKIVLSCGTVKELGKGSFVYIGKGALSPTIFDGYTTKGSLLVDWGDRDSKSLDFISPVSSRSESIIEANHWQLNLQGELVLTASTNSKFLALAPFEHSECPFSQN